MKIDLLRKLPDHMDTVVVMMEEKGNIKNVEFLTDTLKEAIATFVKSDDFTFSYAALKSFQAVQNHTRTNVILCGIGIAAKLSMDKLRQLFASCIRASLKLNARQVYIFPGFVNPTGDVQFGHVLSEAALLAEYKFSKYLSSDKQHSIESVHLALNLKNTRHINRGILEGRIYAEATNLARNLVNEPANVITPESLAEAAKKAALQYGFSLEIFTLDKLKRLKMDAFLAVGRGSKHEPRLIIMKYHGNLEHKNKVIGLVGKGLTYDSGGYCIKTPQGMVNMKNDMAGAAAVIGTFAAIATLKLKINVIGIIAACENMISGDAYRTGDILRSMAGKTIEVINTDAEGRLTLIDAITYAITKEHVEKIIDIATLTGAAVGALGNQISAVVTNDDKWLDKLKTASESSGEKIWQLPAHEDYKELIKSEVADLKNSGGPLAGTITAALFIREFVEEKPWIHIDIAGTALRDKESGVYSYGATGVGVRLLTSLLKEME
ncbi:MAG: leucyl aminopeptidase [Candidatus Cloacimonadaceae bacterium]|nr:leucyl aminopeptidase [Candidatus Cloacimonadaceae bacterium]MDP3114939.1 leucyl aminopeptidase [Candidatus Cloacimonadaceae bacterium]